MLVSLCLAAAATLAAAAAAPRHWRRRPAAAAAAAPTDNAAAWFERTLPAPPRPPIISRPRVSRERQIISARVRWYYHLADQPVRDVLLAAGWPA